ncbi:MAG TPA: hypothetical protein VF070_19030 [Streptosporangiaceae bacterium]
MNDPEMASAENPDRGPGEKRILAALCANEPDALAALFDAYADRLFRYCWFRLRNSDIAQIALRDTLIVAAAQAHRLADARVLTSWLYALARAECGRRRPVAAAEADEPPARPSQPDADSRLMAWNAVASMDPAEAEVLELACRHDVDLGRVLGLPGPQARALLDRAGKDLERALGAEILVSRGSHACPDRAAVLRGWAGTMTPALRERVLRHAIRCPVCGPNLPRNVSAARVFALLPVVPLPPGTRQRVLAFADAAKPAATNPRVTAEPHRSQVLIAMGAAAAVATAAATVVSVIVFSTPAGPHHLAGHSPMPAGAAGPSPSRREGAGTIGALPVAPRPAPGPATLPTAHATVSTGLTVFTTLTSPALTAPLPGTPQEGPPPVPGGPVSVPAPAPRPTSRGTLAVSPGTVDIGSGSQGEVVLTAAGGQQVWSAGTSCGKLSISGYGGTLPAGQSVTLVITINRTGGGGGSALVYIDQGTPSAQTVRVFWSSIPSSPPPPRPSPSPSPSPSSSPPPSPSPSPSSGSSSPGPSPSATAPPGFRRTPLKPRGSGGTFPPD